MKYPLVAILIMTACTLFAQGSNVNMMAVSNGIGIGAAIAVVASWSRNKSVLWAIIHGILGWIYVVYYVITRSSDRD
ncbi:MAG TPA: hypothetical protein PKD16_11635 [Saprospiraceae bacterium]|jgi:hypothetical protein|nr:hypothetical protein [Saprospiraceae bacterium]HMT70807.1 hypothetical protein [Saprospiraceae bacterium]